MGWSTWADPVTGRRSWSLIVVGMTAAGRRRIVSTSAEVRVVEGPGRTLLLGLVCDVEGPALGSSLQLPTLCWFPMRDREQEWRRIACETPPTRMQNLGLPMSPKLLPKLRHH